MPRLVELMERAQNSPDAADLSNRAADLLSGLTASERSPSALFFPSPGGTRGGPIPTLESLRKEYRSAFDGCKFSEQYETTITWYLKTLQHFRKRYEAVGDTVGIPWYFIGILHALEASFNFKAHFYNGDYPLTERTRHVPKNRPVTWLPPTDWASSATDALTDEGFVGKNDWSVDSMLYRWEAYNGFGYRRRGIKSPYLWSFSTYYRMGKFTSDGLWDPRGRSQQCGAAVMLKGLVSMHQVSLAKL